MIIDRLSNAACYRGVGPGITRALDWLTRNDPTRLAAGRHEIDGERLYAMVSEYQTKLRDQSFWEAHRKYIDVQFVVAGVEEIGWAGLADLREIEPYDPAKDFTKLAGEGSFFRVSAGLFAVLFPQDAHMPGIAAGSPTRVRKIVVKVRAG